MAKRPVVFVPGFPGSSLELAGGRRLFPPPLDDWIRNKSRILPHLQGPDDPSEDDGVRVRSPIRYSFQLPLLDLGKEAQSLYDLLEDLGYDTEQGNDFIPVGWDWRLPVDHEPALDALEQAIATLANFHHGKVVCIVHSTGGLVLRALLEKRPQVTRKIARIIALGVPWLGLVRSFLHVAVGQEVRFGPVKLLSRRDSKAMISRAHAAYDLMPPRPEVMHDDEGVVALFTERGEPSSPLVAEGWIDEEPVRQRARASLEKFGGRSRWFSIDESVQVTNVVGWGYQTETHCELVTRREGRAPWFDVTDDGDGTVPRRSAAWLHHPQTSRTLYVPIGWFGDQLVTQRHSQLWNSRPVRSLLAEELKGKRPEPHLWASVDHDDAVDRRRRVRVRVTAADEKGQPLPEAKVRVLMPGPDTELVLDRHLRGEITLSRDGMRANVGARFFRFEVEFSWRGRGRRESRRRALFVAV